MTNFDESDASVVILDLREVLHCIHHLKERVFEKDVFLPSELEELKNLYTTLKSDLKDRSHEFGKVSVESRLNTTEHAFLAPAIRKASVSLSAPINSHPTKWRDGLYCAHMDVAHLLRPLEEMFPGKPGAVIDALRKELNEQGRTLAHTREMLKQSLIATGLNNEVETLAELHSAIYDESGSPVASTGEQRNADCVKESEALATLLARIGV